MDNQLLTELKQYAPIPDYEGFYEISNYGDIRSVERSIITGRGSIRVLPSMPIKATIEKTGYLTITLSKTGSQKKFLIHRLVLIAHVGEEIGKVANHKDGIKSNNCLSNLEWCTIRENTQHAFDNGLAKGKTGISNNLAKHSDLIIGHIKRMILDGKKDSEISSSLNVPIPTIKSIRQGRTRKNVLPTLKQ